MTDLFRDEIGNRVQTVEQWLGEDNQIGIDIWNKKYRQDGESFPDWLFRVSGGLIDIAEMILNKEFLFGGRILATRGIDNDVKASYSNCYVIGPPKDNLESIYDTCKEMARTYSYGGGVGIDISGLAPEGAAVHNQAKTSSGAVSFMDTFSQVTQQIGQKGRRGALMISIDCTHPDLEKFIKVKTDLNKVNYANISVRVSDEFMCAVQEDSDWELSFERKETGEKISHTVKAKDIFRLLCETNWDYAEPGLLFWDRIKEENLQSYNPEFSYAGVNPCGEEPLPAYGSCLLGSLNLAAFVKKNDDGSPYFDKDRFQDCVGMAVDALNDVQQEGVMKHPLADQRKCADEWRQIGLGIMGLGDMLVKMHMVYGSDESLELCDDIGYTFAKEALIESCNETESMGAYPKWNDAVFESTFFLNHAPQDKFDYDHMMGDKLANSQLLTIAPTGTLSTMLNISGGIEPIFANSYTRTTKTLHGDEDVAYKIFTPIVKQYMDENGITDEKDLPPFFITAPEIPVDDRIAMQAVWQKHIDASISSTINLPNSATVDDVADLYMRAWKAGLKGVTVYRAGCARQGILVSDSDKKDEPKKTEASTVYYSPVKNIGLERHLTTGCGSLHVCAYFDENGDLKNTYLSKGSTGGCNNFMIGLSRMISLAARNGLKVEEIVDQLNSCGSCPSYAVRRATKHDTSVGSCCPVAIGNALMDMWKEVNEITTVKNIAPAEIEAKSYERADAKLSCPECGGELKHEMGCVTCMSCGYSKCG